MIKILSNEDARNIRTEQILPNAYALINELVRNSIDGGSTEISIRINVINGSVVYIVEDNGEGIEVNECFLQKGATSKGTSIVPSRELYGYKGMALYSLVGVADFTITTKNREATVRVEVNEKEIKINRTDYHKENRGTTIRVTNYYKAKPIRYNYLFSTLSKDINSIIDMIRKYTVVHKLQFKCYKNDKLIYSTPYSLIDFGKSKEEKFTTDRFIKIYEIGEHKSVAFTGPSISLEYMVKEGKGVEGVIHTEKLVLENQKIDKQIRNSIKLDKRVYYNLSIHSKNYREIAVAKDVEEISRYNIKGLLEQNKETKHHKIIIDSAQSTSLRSGSQDLTQRDSIQSIYSNEMIGTSIKKQKIPSNASVNGTGRLSQPKEDLKENKKICSGIKAIVINNNEEIVNHVHTEAIGLNIKEIAELNIVGQFNDGFIICTLKKPDGIYIYAVDQHSADEAVNYESLKKKYDYKRQKLIKPMKMGINSYDMHIIEENIKEIEKHGFILNDKYNEILEAPSHDNTVFGETELLEIVEEIKEGRVSREGDHVIFKKLRKMLANKACRGSIMIGQTLTMHQMRGVIKALSLTTRPWNCPHGRPTILLLRNPR